MTTSAPTPARRPRVIRPQVGLLLSIGDIVGAAGGGTRPQKRDSFRPKPGQVGQYGANAQKFSEHFGPTPKSIPIVFLSDEIGGTDEIPGNLDIRIKWWGQSGLKGMGKTNFAALPPEEYAQRVDAWDDEVLVFPSKLDEVPKNRQADWKGESLEAKLDGPDDPRIAKTKMKVYTVIRFAIPEITGLATLVEISTTSARSRDNLYGALEQAKRLTGGTLIGIPFHLSVRPTRGRYFDAKERAKKTTEFYELILESDHSLTELYQLVAERRIAIGGGTVPQLALPPVAHGDAERERELSEELWQTEAQARTMRVTDGLGLPEREDTLTRDEPSSVERPDGAQLNRIAQLEEEFGGDTTVLLVGAYGVDPDLAERSGQPLVEQLTREQADQYEKALRRLIDDSAEDGGDAIVVGSEPEPQGGGDAAVVDAEEVPAEPQSFEDMLPPDVKAQRKGGAS